MSRVDPIFYGIGHHSRARSAGLRGALRSLGLEPEPLSEEMKAAIAKSLSAMRSVKVPAKRFKLWPRSVSR